MAIADFNLKNAVELVDSPDRLLLSIFSCLSWPPIWIPENADVVQLQGARCDGMAHAISSFVQRCRWAAAAFFRLVGITTKSSASDYGLGFFSGVSIGVEINV